MRRRDFIGKSVLGTAGFTFGASLVPMPASCAGANDRIVLGLMGAGPRGLDTIVNTCKLNKDVVIKSVCDVKTTRVDTALKTIEKELGYKPLSAKNIKEILDDKEIDAVWISTPEHWHALATVWACQAGKVVYVEKTPSISIWAGRIIVEA